MPEIKYLVVDTSVFIKNTALQTFVKLIAFAVLGTKKEYACLFGKDLGINIITVPDVVREVTSKQQVRRLVVLPYDLQVKETFPEYIKLVTEFSKKTGDYPSLSATDIQVIALTYQLEKEHVGADHIKTEPTYSSTIAFTDHSTQRPEDIAGFYLPAKIKSKCKKWANENSEDSKRNPDIEEDTDKSQMKGEQNVLNNSEESYKIAQGLSKIVLALDSKRAETELPDDQEEQQEEEQGILVHIDDSVEQGDSSSSSGAEDDDYDGDIGWITVDNISRIKREMIGGTVEDKPVEVACITTDFAMQNTLKQMGLNVVALDGKVIRQLRTFILRCYACFKTTSIMTKLFCPNCGNKTLKRVAVSVDAEGKQQIHINLKKPLTARGKRFSLPTPKGGKHANNPIRFEDQPVPDQRPSRLARMKNDPLDPDYIAGFSPFVMHDVYSKSAMLGIHTNKVKHWMRKNPNEAMKNRKKK